MSNKIFFPVRFTGHKFVPVASVHSMLGGWCVVERGDDDCPADYV